MSEYKDFSVKNIIDKLESVDYFLNEETATIIYLAMLLKRPVLVEGPAGVGKTSIATAIAEAFDYEFIKLQCYEGIDESKALYDWEYSKQLLYTQLLKDRLNEEVGSLKLQEAVTRINKLDSLFFSENFLVERPLLKAIRNDKKSLLLIDEIDKAEPEFEAFLLEILSDFTITVPEIGIIKSKQIPLVIMTSNSQRILSDALRRRALFLYVDYPDKELEIKIIKRKVPELDLTEVEKVVEILSKIRKFPLKKHPGTSEGIDLAKSFVMLGGISRENFIKLTGMISKYKNDTEYIRSKIENIF